MNNSRWIKTVHISHTAAPFLRESDSSSSHPPQHAPTPHPCSHSSVPPSFSALAASTHRRRSRGLAWAAGGRPHSRGHAWAAGRRQRSRTASSSAARSQRLPRPRALLFISVKRGRRPASSWHEHGGPHGTARHCEAPVVPCLGRDLGTAALRGTTRQCRRAPPCHAPLCPCLFGQL